MSDRLVLTDTLVPGGSFAKDRAWHLGSRRCHHHHHQHHRPRHACRDGGRPCAPIRRRDRRLNPQRLPDARRRGCQLLLVDQTDGSRPYPPGVADHGRQRKYVSSGFLPTADSIGLVSLAGLLVLVWVTNASAWASTKASVFLAACALFTFWRWLAMGLSTTDAGLRCRYFIRRRTIPWDVADHFEFQYAGSGVTK
jgi:hypothetical protein